MIPDASYKITFLFEHPLFYPQAFTFDMMNDDFQKELSSARTFGFKEELDALKQKSQYVEWHNNKRKAHFGLIAKKIEDKKKLRNKGFIVFDLADFH